jgi:hypothetical protein
MPDALFNYGELRALALILTLNNWYNCGSHYGFNCHKIMVRFAWLPNLTFHAPTLTDARLTSTSEVSTPDILEWLKLRDFLAEFHENQPIAEEVISCGHTHRPSSW